VTSSSGYGSGPNEDGGGGVRPIQMQGILWKRRDVFRNRWRPRWFVLHSDQRVITYYIPSSNQDTEQVVSGVTTSSPPKRRRAQRSISTPTTSSSSMAIGSADIGVDSSSISITNNSVCNASRETNRRRTLSESSTVTAKTIDCDIVPRGSIYLARSTVEANEALTRPQEDLYVLTITDHENSSHYHLAARTVESRDEWIHRIRVCQRNDGVDNTGPSDRRHRADDEPSANRALVTSRGPGRMTTADARANGSDRGDRPGSERDRRGDDTAVASSSSEKAAGLGGGERSETKREALVLFAPLVVYKLLTMTSLFRSAALCFAATSALALRWLLVRHLLGVFRPCADEDGSRSLTPIGGSSVCCRLTEDFSGIRGADTDPPLSHILIGALGKTIDRHPFLVSEKRYLLPRLYSTDVVYLDLDDETAVGSGGVRIGDADEKTPSEISDVVGAAKHRWGRSRGGSFPSRFFAPPACRIVVSTSKGRNRDDDDGVRVDLTLTDGPVTVFASLGGAPTDEGRRKNDETAIVSIGFRSTDVDACREFAKDFQRSVRASVARETK